MKRTLLMIAALTAAVAVGCFAWGYLSSLHQQIAGLTAKVTSLQRELARRDLLAAKEHCTEFTAHGTRYRWCRLRAQES